MVVSTSSLSENTSHIILDHKPISFHSIPTGPKTSASVPVPTNRTCKKEFVLTLFKTCPIAGHRCYLSLPFAPPSPSLALVVVLVSMSPSSPFSPWFSSMLSCPRSSHPPCAPASSPPQCTPMHHLIHSISSFSFAWLGPHQVLCHC